MAYPDEYEEDEYLQSLRSIQPVAASISTDRHFVVPEGHIVKTGYVHFDNIRMGSFGNMAMDSVEKAYRKHVQLGSSASWPPPMGKWVDNTYVVIDGRHEVIGALIAGKSTIFVGWIERPKEIQE